MSQRNSVISQIKNLSGKTTLRAEVYGQDTVHKKVYVMSDAEVVRDCTKPSVNKYNIIVDWECCSHCLRWIAISGHVPKHQIITNDHISFGNSRPI